MITTLNGNILDTEADIVVCPVNCVGTMGAGLARAVKKRFPEIDGKYQAALRRGELTINNSLLVQANGQWISLFPTKWHFRDDSRMEWIERALFSLGLDLHDNPQLTSVAMPMVGCGLGGMDPDKVLQSIGNWWYEEEFDEDRHMLIYR